MRVSGFSEEIKLNFPISKCGFGIKKNVIRDGIFYRNCDEIMEIVCHLDKSVHGFTTVNPIRLNVISVWNVSVKWSYIHGHMEGIVW